MAPRLACITAGLAGIATALVLASAPPAARAASCAGAARVAKTTTVATTRRAVLCLVNAQRRLHGLSAVRRSRALQRAATRHSADMVRRRFFDHVSPSGTTVATRVRAAGYLRHTRAWSLGEAIAWAGGGLATPASIVDQWMHSPPHRAILLHGGFREMGIGVALGTPAGDGPGATFTLDAGRR